MVELPTAREIAEAFKLKLREELTAEQLAEAVRRNERQADPGVCHTHDFCDANMPMSAAWEAIGHGDKIELMLSEFDEDETGQAIAKRWGEAWDLAKAERFEPKPDGE